MKQILIMTLATILLGYSTGSCNPDFGDKSNIVYTDYYAFAIDKKQGFSYLYYFTDLGESQEIAVLPAYVNGYPLRVFGKAPVVGWGGRPVFSGGSEIKLKVIYLPHTLEQITHSQLSKRGGADMLWEKVVFINSSISYGYMGGAASSRMVVYTLDCFANNNWTADFTVSPTEHRMPNITFMLNYDKTENDGVYWIDRVNSKDDLYVIPENPERGGYAFTGWYLEPECQTAWDNVMPIYPVELILFAGWSAQ
jgi:uncharacterized repeat protein (TIGR02543 family)